MKRATDLFSFLLVPLLCAGPMMDVRAASTHGEIALTDLVVLLGGTPSGAKARSGQRTVGEPVVHWFTDVALTDQEQQQAAAAAFAAGKPVAILRGAASKETSDILRALFGVASTASTAIYQRDPIDGGPRITSVDVPDPQPSRLRQLAAQLRDNLLAGSRTHHARAEWNERSEMEKIRVPEIAFSETRYASSGNGSAVNLRGKLTRSMSTSHNTLVLTLKTTHVLKPHQNGLSSRHLIIPARYVYSHAVGMAGMPVVVPKLVGWEPHGDARTDLNISKTTTTTTSFGFGVSPEVSIGLGGDKSPNFGAKLGGNFNFNYQHAVANSLSFQVKDYSIAESARRDPVNNIVAEWTLPLAASIAENIGHFGYPPSPRNMTPNMKQATPEAVSEWSIRGSRMGPIGIRINSSIINQRISGLYPSTTQADSEAQPRIVLLIDASSPYLTPEPTVLIQSKAGNGACVRAERETGRVKLGRCPGPGDAILDKQAQWQFDQYGRYQNNDTGKCMSLEDMHQYGEIVMRPCDSSRNQRWAWQADRIHSLVGQDNPRWRLHVNQAGQLNARIAADHPTLQTLPVNAFHALLKPWSSYPRKPTMGDFIPKLENHGPNPSIPPGYLNLQRVLPAEQWELIVLRESLRR